MLVNVDIAGYFEAIARGYIEATRAHIMSKLYPARAEFHLLQNNMIISYFYVMTCPYKDTVSNLSVNSIAYGS